MARWRSEPLVGFVAIALVLLGIDAWLRPSSEVEVGPGLADAVDRAFEAQHGRPPTEAEHDAAVQGWIDDELLYREGLELGLHEGDPVIRRRVIQQVKQLHRAQAGEEATDAELQALLEAWPERYAIPDRLSFEHRFFGDAQEQAEAWAEAANADGAPAEGGRAFPRGLAEGLTPVDALSRAYGAPFVEALEAGEGWQVLESRYGWHAARATAREAARTPSVDEIRPTLLRDWQADAQDRAEADALDRLRGTE